MKTHKDVEIRISRQEDILPIAQRMRAADVKEVYDSHRFSPCKALLAGMKARGNCWTILGDGIPEGMVGIIPLSLFSDRGLPWMLGTDVLVEDKTLFIRLTRKLFEEAVKGFNYLENYKSIDNKIALRWLESMGFSVAEEPIMVNGVAFKKFYKELS